jgi:hypothetical protein
VFIEGKAGQTGDELERQLFIARKLVEKEKVCVWGGGGGLLLPLLPLLAICTTPG